MKWIVFALALAGVLPMIAIARGNPRIRELLWIFIGALPFIWGIFPKREIALLGEAGWPGFVHGFDISMMDLFLIIAYFSLPPKRHAALPFKYTFAFYISAVFLSALQAVNPIATAYYVWQLLRIFMAYAIIAEACTDTRILTAILRGLAIGICFEFGVVVWQRFVTHHIQASGTFTHQNMLGVAMHFVTFPFFALLLAGERQWQPRLIPILAASIDIFTASRATVGFAGVGFSSLLVFSILRKWTATKARILLAGIVIIVLLSPIAYRQFSLRFSSFNIGGEEGGRVELNDAAALALSDRPMGVGANNFVVSANVNGYYRKADVGIKNLGTFPHNIYWTTAAETGYLGITALLAFLLRPLLFAIKHGWRNRNDRRGDLLLGLGTSLAVVYMHSFYEWSFFTNQIQYLFAIDLGLIAALAEQLRASKKGRMQVK